MKNLKSQGHTPETRPSALDRAGSPSRSAIADGRCDKHPPSPVAEIPGMIENLRRGVEELSITSAPWCERVCQPVLTASEPAGVDIAQCARGDRSGARSSEIGERVELIRLDMIALPTSGCSYEETGDGARSEARDARCRKGRACRGGGESARADAGCGDAAPDCARAGAADDSEGAPGDAGAHRRARSLLITQCFRTVPKWRWARANVRSYI